MSGYLRTNVSDLDIFKKFVSHQEDVGAHLFVLFVIVFVRTDTPGQEEPLLVNSRPAH